jgi:membrane protein YqaA with SNARE-associated domain
MFFYALLITAVFGGLVHWLFTDLSGLFLFWVYSIPSNSIVPVPHEPGLLYFAKYYDPLWIAVAGCLGTGVAAFADYGVVEVAMRHPKINGAREARLFKWSVKWLMRYPFATCFVFSATPLPIYVVRILAPASHYPVGRYVAAIMLGRFPRFYLVAWLGHLFKLPTWSLVAMFVLLIAGLVVASFNTSSDGIDDDEEDLEGEEILVPDLTDPERPKPGISNTRIPRMS